MGRRLAVLFPGIGYHCDKPLLYYSARLARAGGYEVLPVPYAGFPEKVRGDADRLRACVEIAQAQAEAMLASVRWEEYGDVLLIGKSIGTVVASRYAQGKGLRVRSVLLTPLLETFGFVRGEAVAFHGTADPWADTGAVIAACRERNIPLYLTKGANHSLETGDVLRDTRTLEETMARITAFTARHTSGGMGQGRKTGGIHHISMKCGSAEALAGVRRFYCNLLGLPVVHEWTEGILLDTGRGLLEVFTNGQGRCETGAIRHVALAVDDAAQCAEMAREAGYDVFLGPKEILEPCHAVIAFCYGPLGEQVEFLQPIDDLAR